MKTSLDIDDNLYRSVKAIGDKKKMTFRALVEAGLQLWLRENRHSKKKYVMPDARFDGEVGFVEGASEESIARFIRDENDRLAGPYTHR